MASLKQKGLVYQGSLPLSIRLISSMPSAEECARLNRRNEDILRAGLQFHDSLELDEHDAHSLALRRLDIKLNLLFDLFADLLSAGQQLPPACKVSLSASGLVLDGRDQAVRELCRSLVAETGSLQPGCQFAISLYLLASVPSPLYLYGELSHHRQETATDLDISFTAFSPGCAEWLEKYIFRQHRRLIAEERVATSSEPDSAN